MSNYILNHSGSEIDTLLDKIDNIDLSIYAKKSELPVKTSELTNDAGYLTQHQDINGKVDKTRKIAGIDLQDDITANELATELAPDLYDELELDTYALLQVDGIEPEYRKGVPQGQYYYTPDKKKIGIKISEASSSDAGLEVVETYSDTEIDAKIAAITSLSFEVVQTKPTQNIKTNVIYLIPKSESETGNIYEEWIYINNSWELIGTTNIDLSNYVTDADLSAALISKENTANKVATITFGNQGSETLFPTVGATASYIGALTGSLSPQSYGAKANGVDDDTSALQAALDAAALEKKAVFLYGTYKITAPLSVPDNSVIIGSGKYGAAINSSGNSVFTSLNYVKIANIYFTNNSSETASFMSGQATQITITDCTVRGYDNVFAGGIKTLSRIERNSFSAIKKQFAAYVTDSSVTKNYINASKTGFGSTVAFTGSLNNAVIDGNYIDFWTVVFTSVDGKVSTISNNIIDDCYTVFFQRAVNLAIVSNTFSNIKYVEKNWKSGTTYYVPQQYRETPWAVFRFNYSSDDMVIALLPEGKRTSLFHDITFTANSLDSGVDYLIYLQRDSNDKPTVIQYPIYSIQICANSIYPSTLCEFRGLRSKLKAYDYYGNEVAVNMKNVYIETLDRKYYDTLPNPTQSAESSSDPIVTYDGQQAYFQKRLVTNIDGEWYYADGTLVSDNVVYAKLSDIPEKVSELQNDSGYLTQHQDISGKVDKIEGKGLSTNDYTTTEKNKLGGIETGANKTVVDSALSSTSTNPVQNKVIKKALDDLPAVPTKVSELTNDSGYLTLGTLPVYNGGVQ